MLGCYQCAAVKLMWALGPTSVSWQRGGCAFVSSRGGHRIIRDQNRGVDGVTERGWGGGHVAQVLAHCRRCSWWGELYKVGAVRCLLARADLSFCLCRCSLRAYPQHVSWLGRRDVSE